MQNEKTAVFTFQIEVFATDFLDKVFKFSANITNILIRNYGSNLLTSSTNARMKLFDILKEIDDLNEPACMDKILMCLHDIKQEDDLFMELLLKKVGNETITWHQPWYQKCNSYTRPVKVNTEYNVETYRTDAMSKAETNLILQNWYDFIKKYGVPDKLICFARWKNKEKSRLPKTPEECARRFTISYLARGLQRTLFQVFRHVITCYGCPVKGPYSHEEENIMQICFMQSPNDAVTILQMVLGREPRGIYKRLHEMHNGKPEKKKIKWTMSLATKFLNLLLEHTGLPLEALKHRRFDKEIWLNIAEDFGHHYIHLQKFWYNSLHVQLFVKNSIKISKLRRQICNKIKMRPYEIWSDIRWKDIANEFPEGYTHHFLYRTCSGLVRTKLNYQKEPLQQVIDYILAKLKICPKRRLKTLKLNENGELESVLYKK